VFVYLAAKKANWLTLAAALGLFLAHWHLPSTHALNSGPLRIAALFLIAGWYFRHSLNTSMWHMSTWTALGVAGIVYWAYGGGTIGLATPQSTFHAIALWGVLMIGVSSLYVVHMLSKRMDESNAKNAMGQVEQVAETAKAKAPIFPDEPRPTSKTSVRVIEKKVSDVPAERLADIRGMESLKSKVFNAAQQMITVGGAENGILLYGAPGNGKNFLVRAIAGELGVTLISYSFGDAASMWTNQTTERTMKVFDDAIKRAPCVLFLDECDTVLSKRNSANGDGKETQTLTSALLSRMVALRGKGVLLVAATNRMEALDGAAIREGRFDLKIEVTNPDSAARQALIAAAFGVEHGAVLIADDVLDWHVKHYGGFSAARISHVSRVAARIASIEHSPYVLPSHFLAALREAQGMSVHAESTPTLSELTLTSDVQDLVDELRPAMLDPFTFNEAGGEIIKGALFFGPPGTGKTLVARALAKTVGWNLIEAGGAELSRDSNLIAATVRRAIELKPSILFIDEAEPLLRDRENGADPAATAKFLELTGSVASDMEDVLLIAATNLPDTVDAAMLRGGRFERHVRFLLPEATQIASYIEKELISWRGAMRIDSRVLGELLKGRSIADVQFAIKSAKNIAATRGLRTDSRPELTNEDFSTA
jgi:transitional endoplasmic reticulum ATPase